MTPQEGSGSPFLALLAAVRTPVDAALELLLSGEVSANGGISDEVRCMLESAHKICQGGKRLRAALVAAGYEVVSGLSSDRNPSIRGAAVAVELLQSYFLMQDDWMDQDVIRRGSPAAHVALAERFGRSHFGACAMMLAGDFLVALAHRELNRASSSLRDNAAVFEEFTQMQLAAIAGQQLDVMGGRYDALSMYELKTGRYTVSGPLCLGALLGGAPQTALPALVRFALPVGIAFQLRDDLLNLFGETSQTGKPQGSDITAGKWTWTAQWVKQYASDVHCRQVDAAFGVEGASHTTLQSALSAVNDSGAREATEQLIFAHERACRIELSKLAAELRLGSRSIRLLESAVAALLYRRS